MKYFLLIVCACLLLSCSGDKVPKGIIPPPQMETILWQLMQTDEFTADAFTRDSIKNLHTERIRRYRQVFQLNQTSKEAFAKSYEYYMAHPEITKPMFDSINAKAIRLREAAVVKPPGQAAVPAPVVPVPIPVHPLPVKGYHGINTLKLKPASK